MLGELHSGITNRVRYLPQPKTCFSRQPLLNAMRLNHVRNWSRAQLWWA
jgi:hypothetical protein